MIENHSSKNTHYQTQKIVNFYKDNRCTWEGFYESEKNVFSIVGQLRNNHFGKVLDIGCAAGGLGHALLEKFDVDCYHGIDINAQAITYAQNQRKQYSIPTDFQLGDILEINPAAQKYDVVTALSCADWNIETNKIIQRCWDLVDINGYLIISFRLTNRQTVNDIVKSFQYIAFEKEFKVEDCEKANYVIYNTCDLLADLKNLTPVPSSILGNGYWGMPSSTAVCPYKKIGFGVFALHKKAAKVSKTILKLQLPDDLLL